MPEFMSFRMTSQEKACSPAAERLSQAVTAASRAGQRIVQKFTDLDRRDREHLVAAFQLQVLPPLKRGRKRSEAVTAAHADWRSGMRGVKLYSRHIAGFDDMSWAERESKSRSLIRAISSRERRSPDRHRRENVEG